MLTKTENQGGRGTCLTTCCPVHFYLVATRGRQGLAEGVAGGLAEDSLELTRQLLSLASSRSRSGSSLAGGKLGAPQGGECGLVDRIKASEIEKIKAFPINTSRS